MLRQDAEDNGAPTLVLTLTSRNPVTSSEAYSGACKAFWQAWRRNYGPVEYCGFMEWTTGHGPRSGGLRRMHSHWLVKVPDGAPVPTEAWISSRWRELHDGAWRVELAELRHAGGVVGYLALHHEKWEQRPPEGWTGRRLRPSKGYFAEPGHRRRARARLWLQQEREEKREYPRPFGPETGARLIWGRTELEKAEAVLVSGPGRSFDSLPARLALQRQLERAAKARYEEEEPERYERLYAEMRAWLAARARARMRLFSRAAGVESGQRHAG